MRSNLNTSYAYTVTKSFWPIVQLIQSSYPRPLYYFSKELMLEPFLPLVFAMNENCIYKEIFHRFIFSIHDADIRKYWFSKTYLDMIRMKRIVSRAEGLRNDFVTLKFEDFDKLLLLYSIITALCIMVFCLEHCWLRLRKKPLLKRYVRHFRIKNQVVDTTHKI